MSVLSIIGIDAGDPKRMAPMILLLTTIVLQAAAGVSVPRAPAQTTIVVPRPIPALTKRSYTPAEKSIGIEIAQLFNSREMTRRVILEGSATPFNDQLRADPTYGELEKKYPGIIRAIVDKLVAALAQTIDVSLDELWDRMGIIYAETFDRGELERLVGFYKSDTGRKLIAGMMNGIDMNKAIAAGLKNPDGEVTAKDIERGYKPGAVVALTRTLTPKQRLELMELSMSPIGAKLARVNPRISQAVADWTNEITAAQGGQMTEVVIDAGREFIEQSQAADRTPGPKT